MSDLLANSPVIPVVAIEDSVNADELWRALQRGGIHLTNMNDYLSLPNVYAVGGTWIAPSALINAKDWDAIKKNAKEAIEQAAKA